MPPAKFQNAAGLDIVLAEDTPQVLYPGATVSGRAILSTIEDSVSIGSVTATLYGRTKCKIWQSHGQSSAVYTSRARLFDITQELFKSDFTYKGGDYSWPFNFQLPFVADETCLTGKKQNRFKPHRHFLSTDNIDVIDQEMPPPVFHYHSMFGRAVWAYVEYVLEVTVTDAPSSHHFRGPQSRKSTRPLNFQPGRREEILKDYGFQTKSEQLNLKSSRLGANEADLAPSAGADHDPSFAPTTSNDPVTRGESKVTSPLRNALSRLSISSTSTPRLALNCTVTYPTTIQVHHPDPVPFYLSITPDPDPQATNIDPSLPTIRIKSLDLRLLCTTHARTVNSLFQMSDNKNISIYLAKDAPLDHSFKLVPSTTSEKAAHRASSSAASALTFQNELPNTDNTINLTTLLPHPARLLSAKTGRSLREPLLIPTFKTYNLSREFGLKWVIELEIITPQKTFTEKLKGEVPKGGIIVRGVPDSLRADAMAAAGVGKGSSGGMTMGMDGAVDFDAFERGDMRDAGDDEDANDGDDGDDDNDHNREGRGAAGGATDEKKGGLRGLFRRSHDGGSGGAAAAATGGGEVGKSAKPDKEKNKKEEYAREDRRAAAAAAAAEEEAQAQAQAQAGRPSHGEQLPKYEA